MGVCVVVTLRNLKIEHFDAYFSIIKIAVSAAMARLFSPSSPSSFIFLLLRLLPFLLFHTFLQLLLPSFLPCSFLPLDVPTYLPSFL